MDTTLAIGFGWAQNGFALTTNTTGPVTYTAFDGTIYTMQPWLGRNIVVLAPPTSGFQTNVMGKVIGGLDRAYDFYEAATARRPQSWDSTTFQGRDTIAVVNSTCGAGCSEVGATGTEILTQYFQILYNDVASANQYDQVLFYEFGRSFWFYTPQLAYQGADHDPVLTGFAVYMRFMSMDAAGVQPGPFNGGSFATFRTTVTNLIDTYVITASLNWSNTFRVNVAPPNALGLGGTDFIASLLMRIGRDFGDSRFALQFWKEAEFRPFAHSTQDAADNFVLAASAAVRANLTRVFSLNWKWPVSATASAEAASRWGNPVSIRPRYSVDRATVTQVRLSWPSEPNALYQPQESSDLRTWFNVGDPLAGDGSFRALTNSSAVFPRRYFRLKIQ